MEIADRGYAHPDVLVSTQWVADHLDDPNCRLIEANEDPLLYDSGHIPGAAEIEWTRDLNDPLVRDYLDCDAFAQLMQMVGVTPETTVVLYGDKTNWWATYVHWVFQLFSHPSTKIMDGGRFKWEKEGRELSQEAPSISPSHYKAPPRDDSTLRVFRKAVAEHLGGPGKLIDVRSREEYTGERLHMEAYPNEGALRGGHIPGAVSIPWSRAVSSKDGTFRSAEELRSVYEKEFGIRAEDDVVVYCRIGERSAHTLFALKYLLGYTRVRNYDGSWVEWGNLVGAPIER